LREIHAWKFFSVLTTLLSLENPAEKTWPALCEQKSVAQKMFGQTCEVFMNEHDASQPPEISPRAAHASAGFARTLFGVAAKTFCVQPVLSRQRGVAVVRLLSRLD
jgi:hypothetical protein